MGAGSTATLLRNFQANAATPAQGWRLCPKNRLLRRVGAGGRERCVVQRHVAHLLRGQPGGHRAHEVGIGRAAAVFLLEEFELQDEIVGVLAGESGIDRVAAGGAGAVAGDAGGDALTRDAAAGDRLAALDRQRECPGVAATASGSGRLA